MLKTKRYKEEDRKPIYLNFEVTHILLIQKQYTTVDVKTIHLFFYKNVCIINDFYM